MVPQCSAMTRAVYAGAHVYRPSTRVVTRDVGGFCVVSQEGCHGGSRDAIRSEGGSHENFKIQVAVTLPSTQPPLEWVSIPWTPLEVP